MATQMLDFKMGDHEAWRTEYNGHEILIVNKGRTRLVIDGEEVAVQQGRIPLASKINLIGTIKQTGELVIVTLNGSVSNEYRGCRTVVHVYVGQELGNEYGYVDTESKFTKFEGHAQLEQPRQPRTNKSRKITLRRKKKNTKKD